MKITFSNKKEAALLPKLFESKKFSNWVNKLTKNFDVEGILIHKVNMFGQNVGFIYAEANCFKDGKKMPGIALIRGDSCAILTVILEKETRLQYLALVDEMRVPAGERVLSIPAGMVDENEVKGASIKELEEELGLTSLDVKKLVFLDKGYSSPGGSDEEISIFYYEIVLPTKKIEELNGKETGESNEAITVRVVPFDKSALRMVSSVVAKYAMLSYWSKGL